MAASDQGARLAPAGADATQEGRPAGGHHRDEGHVGQSLPTQTDLSRARQGRRHHPADDAQQHERQPEPRSHPADRESETLDQMLDRKPGGSRTQSESSRGFAGPSDRLRQQEVRDVHADEDEDEGAGDVHRYRDRPDVSHHPFLKPFHPDASDRLRRRRASRRLRRHEPRLRFRLLRRHTLP